MVAVSGALSVRQILGLGIALLCALVALFVVRNMSGPRTRLTPAASAPIAGLRVLVASKNVEAGSRIGPESLEWRDWTQAAVSPNFVQQSQRPTAIQDFTGAVARQAIVAGEPIVAERVVKAGDQGFMAAIVRPGFRAVSVKVSQESAASGFILPNDRVDVILTRKVTMPGLSGSSNEQVRSGVVLQDVRVLAIDQTYKQKAGDDQEATTKPGVALLELSPRDCELLAMADEMGDLSLALRSVENQPRLSTSAAVRGSALDQGPQAARDQIRIHAFGEVKTEDAQAAQGLAQ